MRTTIYRKIMTAVFALLLPAAAPRAGKCRYNRNAGT